MKDEELNLEEMEASYALGGAGGAQGAGGVLGVTLMSY